jgi:hypothetical protein
MSLRLGTEPRQTGERLCSPVRVDLDGRFMLPSKEEHSCKVVDMSTEEMLISCSVTPAIGDQAIVYIAELGRFEGKVKRQEENGFFLGLSLTEHKRGKLADQLLWFANCQALALKDNRRHKRFVPLNQLTTVRFSNGKECMARINDISASGVALEVNLTVTSRVIVLVGSNVLVGKKSAKVIRIFDGGFVARFDETFDEDAIDETVVL